MKLTILETLYNLYDEEAHICQGTDGQIWVQEDGRDIPCRDYDHANRILSRMGYRY